MLFANPYSPLLLINTYGYLQTLYTKAHLNFLAVTFVYHFLKQEEELGVVDLMS
jgi:hypothetical protein